MSIDMSKIKAGDTVTLEVQDPQWGTYTITGEVQGRNYGHMFVGGRSLEYPEGCPRTVIDHKPVWREPEGWQEWDGLSIDGERWFPSPHGGGWFSYGDGRATDHLAIRMQGKTVTRLMITEQAPA